MAQIINEDWTGAADGVTCTFATCSADTVSGAFTHSTDFPIDGMRNALECDTASSAIADWDTLPSRNDTGITGFFILPEAPSASSFMIEVYAGDGTTVAGQIGFNTSGQIRIRDGFSQVGTPFDVPYGQLIRYEYFMDGGGGQDLTCWTGTKVYSRDPQDAFGSTSGALTATTFTRILCGSITGVSWRYWHGLLLADNAVVPDHPFEYNTPRRKRLARLV